MKIAKRHILSILLLIYSGIICYSQSVSPLLLDQANKLYNNQAYYEAIEKYLGYVKKDNYAFHPCSYSAEAMIKLADCYRLINDTQNTELWYKKIVDLPEAKPIHRLYLAEALMQNNKYSEAKYWLEECAKDEGNDPRALKHLEVIRNPERYSQYLPYYKISKINISSSIGDFCPVFYENGIVFTSARRKMSLVNRTQAWTGKGFYSLYFAERKDSVTFSKPTLFAPELKSKYNDGPSSISKSYQTIFITRNSGDQNTDNNAMKLKIYESHKSSDGKRWDERLIPFPLNSNRYNCAHPCISPDGSKLYFASDIEGGVGGMDIYICKRDGSTWGEPKNLGPEINTKGNELYPYIADDGTLYFASNGLDGLGGLDIYFCTPMGASFSRPHNLGSPINSMRDDFGIILEKNGQSGYFSSNRDGSNDNIFQFYNNKPKPVLLTIRIADSLSSDYLTTASIKIQDRKTGSEISLSVERNRYIALLQPSQIYTIEAKADNYGLKKITYGSTTVNESIDIQLRKINEFANIEIGVPVKLGEVHFATAQYDISPSTERALEKVVKFLTTNSSYVIEFGSHTDCRGSARTNFDLSDKRVRQIAEYVIGKGIDPKRITSIGYGESIPLNNCDCEGKMSNPCSDDEYRVNERIELKVIGYLRNGVIYSE